MELIELQFCTGYKCRRVSTTGPGDTIRQQRPIVLLIEGVVAEFRRWVRGLRPSDRCNLVAVELVELLFTCRVCNNGEPTTTIGERERNQMAQASRPMWC